MDICRFDAEKLMPKLVRECDPVYAFTFFQLFLMEREKHPRESFEYVWDKLPVYTEDIHQALLLRTLSH